MPETTVTGWELRIKQQSDSRGLALSRSKIQRLARRAQSLGLPYEGAWQHLSYRDPTGATASTRASRPQTRRAAPRDDPSTPGSLQRPKDRTHQVGARDVSPGYSPSQLHPQSRMGD